MGSPGIDDAWTASDYRSSEEERPLRAAGSAGFAFESCLGPAQDKHTAMYTGDRHPKRGAPAGRHTNTQQAGQAGGPKPCIGSPKPAWANKATHVHTQIRQPGRRSGPGNIVHVCVHIGNTFAALGQCHAPTSVASRRSVGRDELVVELAGHHLKQQSVNLKASNSEAQTLKTRADAPGCQHQLNF